MFQRVVDVLVVLEVVWRFFDCSQWVGDKGIDDRARQLITPEAR
jgi:hypothetical protein